MASKTTAKTTAETAATTKMTPRPTSLTSKLAALPKRTHALLVGFSFIALGVVNTILNDSYDRSLFPVPYAEGQTTFDGDKIKEFYQFMTDRDTLGIYWQTQLIDFGFIIAMASLGLTLGTLIAKLHRPGSLPARLASAAAWLIPLGAAFDVIENLISFVMLSQPDSFPNWLAIPYSTAAVTKFALIAAGMICIVIAVAALAIPRARLAAEPAPN